METLDTLVTYAYDLTLGGGAFYIGTSLILYLADRWRELEVKPKSKPPLNIPLELKAATAEMLPLAAAEATRPLEAMPLDLAEPELSALPTPSELVE